MINRLFTVLLSTVVLLMFTGCGSKNPDLIKEDGALDKALSESTNNPMDSYDNDKGTLFVHISGEVIKPGVYELPVGSRLYEAIEAAGGYTDKASTDYLNMAMLVEDGKQYEVLTKEAALLQKRSEGNPSAMSHYDAEGRLNINLATKEELMTLNGIGASRADAIISFREDNEAFALPEDIMKVSGIKQSLYSKIEDSITVN